MTHRIQSIKNHFSISPLTGVVSVKKDSVKNVSYAIPRLQFARIRQDIGSWREAIKEAENPWYPYRVAMQRIYQDTILNEHVIACMNRRADLTLLRDFKICDESGNESDELKTIFRNHQNTNGNYVNTASWFDDFVSYVLDALALGYSLISLGDVISDAYPELAILPRQNTSPDRLVYGWEYTISGIPFTEDPYVDWHVWVPTLSKLGVSKCGFGYLYEVAKSEIYLRQNIAHNADYNEVFGQPIRKGKTTKTDEVERANFEASLRNMGSSAYILLDDGSDEVELIEAKNSGTTYNTYADFEKRLEAKISKVILGHADALDSVPGKLGSGQGNGDSPVQQALADKQSKDGIFVQNVVNALLLPRMRKHGFKIPENYHFEYKNDQEKEEFRMREDESNTKTATLFKTIADAGGDLTEDSWKYFTERTGIPVKVKEPVVVPPVLPNIQETPNDNNQQKATEEV